MRRRYVPLLIIGVILFLAIYVGLFIGAGRISLRWLGALSEGLSTTAFWLVYAGVILLVLAAFMSSRIPGAPIPRAVCRAGHYGMGVLIYLMLFIYCTALVLSLGRLVHLIPTPEPRAVTLTAAALCLALVAGLSIYGGVHGASIKRARYTVTLGEGAEEMDALRIALVSDIHMGYVVEEAHLSKIVKAINEMEPDLVCIAGDIFDGEVTSLSDPEALKALFRSLDAKHGVYACLGNHDAGPDHEEMLAFLAGAGVELLRDETAVIDGRVLLAGRKDSTPIGAQGVPREPLVLPAAAEGLPVIVLDHQPGNIGEYGEETDLILCGHTHRGQMFPMNLFTGRLFNVDYGYFRASDTSPQVIVTSGAGTWGPPMRVGSDSEVVDIQVLFPKP